jgi:hypothetical protein
MDIRSLSKTDVLSGIVLVLLLLCSWWGVSFSQSCKGDKCFGMIVPVGAWIIVFIVQVISLLADAFLRWRAKKPFGLRALGWFVASLGTGAVPLLLMT